MSSTVKAIIINMQPIGSLQVYAQMTQEEYDAQVSYENKVYWSDNKAADGQGPFRSVYDAVDNYKNVVLARRELEMAEVMALNISTILNPTPGTAQPKDNIIDMAAWKLNRLKYNRPKIRK